MDLNAFKSQVQGESVTKICKVAERNVLGRDVIVVDTPGLFDTSTPNPEMIKEIIRCMYMTTPGPHVVLLTISIAERLTPEVVDSIKIFFACFGEKIKDYIIVVFTNADRLTTRRETKSIEAFVNEIQIKEVKQFLLQCGMRYVAFNNQCKLDSKENEDQVKALLDMVQQMVAQNGGSYLTNDMFQEVDSKLKEADRNRYSDFEDRKESENQHWSEIVRDIFKEVIRLYAKTLKDFEELFFKATKIKQYFQ